MKRCPCCLNQVFVLPNEGYAVCSYCGLIIEKIYAPRPLQGYLDPEA